MDGAGGGAGEAHHGQCAHAVYIGLALEAAGDPTEEYAPFEEQNSAEGGEAGLLVEGVFDVLGADRDDGHEAAADEGEEQEEENVVAFDVAGLVAEDGLDFAVVHLLEHAVGDEDVAEWGDDAHDGGVDEHAAGAPDENFAAAEAEFFADGGETVAERPVGQAASDPDMAEEHWGDDGDENGRGAEEEVGEELVGEKAVEIAAVKLDDIAGDDDEEERGENEQDLVAEIEGEVVAQAPDGADGFAADEVELQGDLADGAVGAVEGDPDEQHGDEEGAESDEFGDDRPVTDAGDLVNERLPGGEGEKRGLRDSEERLREGEAAGVDGLAVAGVVGTAVEGFEGFSAEEDGDGEGDEDGSEREGDDGAGV